MIKTRQATAEPNYLGHSRFWFPEDMAPFGELNFVRADRLRDIDSTLDMHPSHNLDNMLDASRLLLSSAWVSSTWLKKAVPDDMPYGEIRNSIDESSADKLEDFITEAAEQPWVKSAWFALRPPSHWLNEEQRSAAKGLISIIGPELLLGFGTSKNDISGNFVRQAYKEIFHPEKIYAKTNDINVFTHEQAQHIGATLFYFGLGMFRPNQKPTIYTADEGLIKKLGDLGYQVTGSQERTDFIPGVTVDEARLQAESVSSVRNQLRDRYKWLGQAIVVDKNQRP
jgi:hypothetical protein